MSEVFEVIERRFTSLNSVPVERVHITGEEWNQIKATLAQSGQSAEPVTYLCHSCGNEAPPPAPFSMSVRCPCGHSTAATIAADLARQAQPQPAQQGSVPEEEERLTDIYRRKLFECQDELNNLRSEYHNRTAELETEIEDLQEELQRVRRQPDVPEGWKLVPAEPTESMITAFEHAPCAENYTDAATWSWRAMLSAAPAAQQGSVPESAPSRDDLVQCLLATRGQSEGVAADAILSLFSATTPQPAQQGSVPEGWSLTHIDDPATDGYLVKGPGISYCAWKDKEPWLYLFCEALATTPRPEGDGWIKCSERLPKLGQRVQLFSQGVIQHMMPLFDDSDEGLFWDFEVHDYNPPVDMSRDQWRPLPQPPKEGA